MAETKKVPLGPAMNLTPEELDEAAEVNAIDIRRVNARWEQAVPNWAVNIMLAELDNG